MKLIKIVDEYYIPMENIKLILGTLKGKTAGIKSMIEYAKNNSQYYDLTVNKKWRSVILLSDNSVIISSISAETLSKRIAEANKEDSSI